MAKAIFYKAGSDVLRLQVMVSDHTVGSVAASTTAPEWGRGAILSQHCQGISQPAAYLMERTALLLCHRPKRRLDEFRSAESVS